MQHPRRWNVTTTMVGLKTATYAKNLTENGEPQRYSRGTQRRRRRNMDMARADGPGYLSNSIPVKAEKGAQLHGSRPKGEAAEKTTRKASMTEHVEHLRAVSSPQTASMQSNRGTRYLQT